jgi:putative ABC transport system ATP-binding protein
VLFDNQLRRNKDAVVSKHRRKIGFVFQDFQLINRYTVQKNLETASVIKLGYVDKERISEVLEEVEMSSKAESYPDELSGGQKQRISIARAMLAKPDLLIADEPTGAIDEENTENILAIIDKLHKDTNTTIIIVTHDMDVAQRADRIIELRDGVISNDRVLL